jgi:Ser/Thr protein kinase RdoA (MazF antagonist)
MDDQQTYLLNGLLSRQFGLGRIVRFRKVQRGRQAAAFELFTVQEREYLVQLYPATFAVEQLEFIAGVVNSLDVHRFSVVPFVSTRAGPGYVGEGPQGTRMLVSLAPAGSILQPHEYTEHDLSQIGLRLAWMHRLLKEEIPGAAPAEPLAKRMLEACRLPDVSGGPAMDPAQLEPLLSALQMQAAPGWVHGDIQKTALLLDGDHQIRTMVDWALLHRGSPLEDMVDALLSFGIDSKGMLVLARGKALVEAYHSLVPIEKTPWTPVVASWCAQRIIDARTGRRPTPQGFSRIATQPEELAMAMASCC